jgi:hypothetical protein
MVTSVQNRMDLRGDFLDASVDPTDARNALVPQTPAPATHLVGEVRR